jgi:hypothetical protein
MILTIINILMYLLSIINFINCNTDVLSMSITILTLDRLLNANKTLSSNIGLVESLMSKVDFLNKFN